jgi:predicted dehydrogenase
MKDRPSRRKFLGITAAAAAATWTGSKLLAASAPARPAPNDTLTLGLIGCGARARQLVSQFAALPDARIAALADVNSKHLQAMAKTVGDEKVRQYHDYRKLLEQKDLDAVIVATQAHWHVLITIHACQAGKDVYVEKPLGNFIGEGRFALDAARKYHRIVQIGTQQRSREHYRQACELIQSGALGNISEVKVWDFENWSPGRGSPPNCHPPAELDWDLYVGPSPMVPYNPNIYFNYGYDWFRISGGGHQVAWGVHHLDVVQWAMGVKWPIAATAAGGKFAFPDDNREWPDTFSGILEYGPGPVAKHGFVLQYTMRIGCRPEHRAHAKCFFGTAASMTLDRGRYTVVAEAPRMGGKTVADVEVLAGEDEARHAQVFLDNVRTRTKPLADVEVGHSSTNACHLMNAAYLVGRRIRWDGEKEQVIDDPQANALVHREYRSPWGLKVT